MKKKNVTKTKTGTTVNKSRFLLLSLMIIALGSISLTSYAQCSITNKAFSAGESATYNLYFNWKFIWLKAGTATLTTNSTTYQGEPAYQIEIGRAHV